MCKVTKYIDSCGFGYLYDVVSSQRQYFDWESYWDKSANIYLKQFAIWERLSGSANGDRGNVAIHLICLHQHLKLSNRTSPYSIIKELREYLSSKIGEDIFDIYKFEQWQKQFPNGRFSFAMHNFKNLII